VPCRRVVQVRTCLENKLECVLHQSERITTLEDDYTATIWRRTRRRFNSIGDLHAVQNVENSATVWQPNATAQ
jgi:hypothetical protein